MKVNRLRSKYGQEIDWYAYTPYRQLKRKIQRVKKTLIKDIMEIVEPHMWETGYVKSGNMKDGYIHSRGYFFEFSRKRMEDGKEYYKVGTIELIGFMEGGNISYDACGGGLLNGPMSVLSIEDIMKLHVWVLNRKEFKNK